MKLRERHCFPFVGSPALVFLMRRDSARFA
jgi:hypothetical protein